MHAQSLQSCPTLCDPMDHSPPGSSVYGILQAKILDWVARPSSKGCLLQSTIKLTPVSSFPPIFGVFLLTVPPWCLHTSQPLSSTTSCSLSLLKSVRLLVLFVSKDESVSPLTWFLSLTKMYSSWGYGIANEWVCVHAHSCPTVAHQVLCPWSLPGKNTGVGCHFFLQGILLTLG